MYEARRGFAESGVDGTDAGVFSKPNGRQYVTAWESVGPLAWSGDRLMNARAVKSAGYLTHTQQENPVVEIMCWRSPHGSVPSRLGGDRPCGTISYLLGFRRFGSNIRGTTDRSRETLPPRECGSILDPHRHSLATTASPQARMRSALQLILASCTWVLGLLFRRPSPRHSLTRPPLLCGCARPASALQDWLRPPRSNIEQMQCDARLLKRSCILDRHCA